MALRRPGRQELLQWLNDFLDTDYARVEHLQDGVAYSQIFDALYPAKYPLHKINMEPSSEEDNTRNLTILSDFFRKMQIPKAMSAERLAKGKFQDHIDLLQWCYDEIVRINPSCMQSYNAYERRESVIRKQRSARGNKSKNVNYNIIPSRVSNSESTHFSDQTTTSNEITAGRATSGSYDDGQGYEIHKRDDDEPDSIDKLITMLEQNLTERLFEHQTLKEEVERTKEHRDFLLGKLLSIERITEPEESELGEHLRALLYESSQDFARFNGN